MFVCLFIYLVLKHSFQGLVKDLDGNENKNINIKIDYKGPSYFVTTLACAQNNSRFLDSKIKTFLSNFCQIVHRVAPTNARLKHGLLCVLAQCWWIQ